MVPFVALGTGALVDLWQGFYLGLDLAAETHFMRLRRDAASPIEQTAQFALRGSLSAGRHF
jgi:hypothetical protein